MKKPLLFTSREKLSKKARREMDQSRRAVWNMSPVTRVKQSDKAYNRAAAKLACRMY